MNNINGGSVVFKHPFKPGQFNDELNITPSP